MKTLFLQGPLHGKVLDLREETLRYIDASSYVIYRVQTYVVGSKPYQVAVTGELKLSSDEICCMIREKF